MWLWPKKEKEVDVQAYIVNINRNYILSDNQVPLKILDSLQINSQSVLNCMQSLMIQLI
jgi:hypothetical protein